VFIWTSGTFYADPTARWRAPAENVHSPAIRARGKKGALSINKAVRLHPAIADNAAAEKTSSIGCWKKGVEMS